MTYLTRRGFSLAACMKMTPRQLAAFCEISASLDRREMAADLSVAATAARAKDRDIKERIRKLNKD